MSKKGATSSHTLEAKSGALLHNRREVKLSNVNPHLSHLNDSWESSIIIPKEKGGEGKSIDQLKHERAAHYALINGRSAPGYGPNGTSVPPDRRTAFIRESCVVIKPETTMEDVRRFADSVCSAFGVKCLGIWIHKDEGYHRSKWIEGDADWKANLHAHVLFDWYIFEKGRVARTTSNLYSAMQDMAAAALNMDRGERSERRHVASKDYALEQANRRISSLKLIEAQTDSVIKIKEREIQQQNFTLKGNAKELAKVQINNLLQSLIQHKLREEIDNLKKQQSTNERSIKAQQSQLNSICEEQEQKAKELSKMHHDNQLQTLLKHKLNEEIASKQKELEGLEAKRAISEKAQLRQLENLENALLKAKENNEKETQKLEHALQAKRQIYQESMRKYDAKIQEISQKLADITSQIEDKTQEINMLQSQIEQYGAWVSQFINEQQEVAEAWEESWDEFERNTAGQPYDNRMEQLVAYHERLEAIFAPLLKGIIEKAPEVARREIRSLPVKEAAKFAAFLSNKYPAIAPLLWGSAPGVVGSEPRRRRRGDDDDDDEYNGGISR